MGMFIFLFSSFTFAGQVTCSAWYQEKGGKLETMTLPVIASTAKGVTYKGSFHGREYNVLWNKDLTTYYVSIGTLMNSTARVPTDNHPETFAQVNLPDGPMLAINCAM